MEPDAKIAAPESGDEQFAAFASDALLPPQMDGRYSSKIEPEKRLLLAVLEQAFLDLRGRGWHHINCPGSRRRFRADAEAWFFGAPGDGIFAFENICDALGFDPDWIRKRLYALKRDIPVRQIAYGKMRIGAENS